jgi:hypothetical protein
MPISNPSWLREDTGTQLIEKETLPMLAADIS